MIRLVRRQTNFFPTPSSTASPPTNDSTSSPSASVSTSAPSSTPTPNASLFPTITTTLSSSAFTAQPTTSTSSPSPPASTSTTSTNSSSTPSLFVLQRGSSIHKLWWIVMLDLLLWFAQRRRTRSQTALDKARSFVISQLTASSKKS
ncbi:hypothetical protein [Sporisorium scitamineum]|nr:hypothetical protein [Sporisorium scitamineum]